MIRNKQQKREEGQRADQGGWEYEMGEREEREGGARKGGGGARTRLTEE